LTTIAVIHKIADFPLWMLACLYAAICLMPLFLAAFGGAPRLGLWPELSSGAALLGYAMLLMQFLLSGRFRGVTGTIGIDLVMRFHQAMGRIAIVFVLAHPLLYAGSALWSSPANALRLLQSLFSLDALRTGVVAWGLAILLVPLAVWRHRLPVPYEIWRLSHGLGAAAIAALGFHHLLRIGLNNMHPSLRDFWAVLLGVAFLSLAHVYLITPLLQLRAPYRVVSKCKVADRMWELVAEPRRGPAIDFVSGQFVWFKLGRNPFGLSEHPFSISSAPAQRPRIAFTIKESGDFTARIGDIPIAATAYLAGPHGNFTLARGGPGAIVFVAGGVGLAPIISMLRQLAAERYPHPVSLIYGNRQETQILYRDEIERMSHVLNLETHLVLSEPQPGWQGGVGELTPDVLKRCLGADSPRTRYFVCGPAAMMDSVVRSLRDRGVPERRVVTERFDLAAAKGHGQNLQARLLAAGLATIFAVAVLVFAFR
jgi:predicted ferric reductase